MNCRELMLIETFLETNLQDSYWSATQEEVNRLTNDLRTFLKDRRVTVEVEDNNNDVTIYPVSISVAVKPKPSTQGKLSIEDVRLIKDSSATAAELAARHKVSESSIYNIRRGRSWKFVDVDDAD